MANEITSLVTNFSFAGSLTPLKVFNADLAGGIFLIGEFASAVVDTVGAISSFASETLDSVHALDVLSDRTGVSTQKIQELRFVAEQTDATAGALDGTLQSLTERIGSASIEGDDAFSRLGINIRDANGQLKTAEDVLDGVRVRFQQMGLSVSQQQSFASSLGIDTSLLGLLSKSSDEMSELAQRARELGVLTSEQVDITNKYRDATIISKFALSGLKNEIAVGFAPLLTETAENFTNLITENKSWITDALNPSTGSLGVLIDMFERLTPIIIGAAGGFALFSLATSPLTMTIALVGGIALVLDDLLVAFKGGKSVIRDFFQEFFGFDVTPILHDITDSVIEQIEIMKDGFVAFFDFVSNFDYAKLLPGQETLNAISEFFSPLGDIFQFGGGLVPGVGGGPNTSTQNTVNQTINQTIVSSDPTAAARASSNNIQQQMRDAANQLGRGGR